MATIQSLKSRIESIKKTAAITKAMHRIAASKLNSTQNLLQRYRFFESELNKVITEVTNQIQDHQLLTTKIATKKLYILITSDRGLAGGYHQQLFNAFLQRVSGIPKSEFSLLVIGKKGFYFAQKNGFEVINTEVISNRDQLSVINYTQYIDIIEQLFLTGKIQDVTLVYNHFINALKQEVTFETLLPIKIQPLEQNIDRDFLYEGEPAQILENLIIIYLQSRIYGVMVDAKLSEFSSRIVAMKQATDNSNEVLSVLQLQYHQARQQKITSDLLDIANGKQ